MKDMGGSTTGGPLRPDQVRLIDAYWRAANYLSVGQIYLLDNPLLTRPLRFSDIKPRLLGHWGTTPGLNFIYAHLNRVISERDLRVLYVAGPGHGGPTLIATPISKARTASSVPTSLPTWTGCGGCSASSRSPAARRRAAA